MQATNFWNLYYLSSKKIMNLLCLLVLAGVANAQYNIQKHDRRNEQRGYSYGIHLGASQHNFRVEHSDKFLEQTPIQSIEGSNDLGLEVGIIGALHPFDNLEVRALPTIAFGDRSLNYYDLAGESDYPNEVNVESTMFDIPLQVKYKSKPYKDFRMFVVGGGKYRMNLSYKEEGESAAEDALRYSKSDMMGELGLGAEFHFPLFTLAPELKVSQGFLNQRIQNDNHPYSANLSALYSRMYTFSINIE